MVTKFINKGLLKSIDMWKVPGGLVDDGEFISQAAEREVNKREDGTS